MLIDKKVWLVNGIGRGMGIDIAKALVDSMTGLARPLQADTRTRINPEESASSREGSLAYMTEVMVNGADDVFVERERRIKTLRGPG